VEILGGLLQTYPASRVAFDAIQDLIDAGPFGDAAQFTGEELLQGLAASLGPALEGGVNIVGQVAYQHVRHAYIMIALLAACNAVLRRGMSERLCSVGALGLSLLESCGAA
jgi:hypothetical protein